MSEKIIGYILLTVGILVIVLAGINIYLVFVGEIKPVQLFSLPAPQIDMAQLISGALPQGIVLPSQQQELIPKETLNGPLNFTAHIFIMGFLASIGQKLASIGVYLLRPIVVKLKEAPKEVR